MYNTIKNPDKLILPRYVKLGNITEMRYIKNDGYYKDCYYRDAGIWSIDYKFVDGKLFTHCPNDSLDNIELIEITQEEWKKGNRGYLPSYKKVVEDYPNDEIIKKKYTIEISGTYNALAERELSEDEYNLIKGLSDELDTDYECLRIHEGWGLGVKLGV